MTGQPGTNMGNGWQPMNTAPKDGRKFLVLWRQADYYEVRTLAWYEVNQPYPWGHIGSRYAENGSNLEAWRSMPEGWLP